MQTLVCPDPVTPGSQSARHTLETTAGERQTNLALPTRPHTGKKKKKPAEEKVKGTTGETEKEIKTAQVCHQTGNTTTI